MLIPKKKVIERAKENGSIDRVDRLLSASHLLISVYLDMVSETQDILRDNGMFMGDIKEKYGTLQKAFDVYFYEFTKLINNDKRKKDYREDYDEFNASFRKWAKL